MGLFTCVKMQLPESDGNGETTLEKGETNPLDVTLDDIAENVLSFLNGFKSIREAKKVIEKKYEIKKEHGDCWSADDIKRAWGQTQRMDIKSSRRRYWAHVIILQMLKRFMVYDERKQKAAQEDHDDTTNETKQSCETRPGMKKNSEDTSSQSSDELETVEAAGGESSGAKLKSSKSDLNPTGSTSKSQSGARVPGSQTTRNDPGAPADQSRTIVSTASESEKADEIICIRIPFSNMFRSVSPRSQHVARHSSHYKLIDGFPSDTDLMIRKSYAMSFDTETNNAELVYEILNRETLVDRCEQLDDFGHGYVKGHLAAARNHKWCREAFNDAGLFSNMIPQNGLLNNGTWRKLENYCRRMIKNEQISNVHVYTGPLYQRSMDLELSGKRVPSHLFKVIIVENVNGTVEEPECYKMPNETPQNNNLTRVNIGELQTVSGLTFIERRPKKNMRDYTKLVILQGEDVNEEPCTVNISVRISS